MTMSPDAFKDLLDTAVESPPPAPGGELRAGRRLRRRRRIGASLAGVAVLAVLGGAAFATGVAPGSDRAQDDAAVAGSTAAAPDTAPDPGSDAELLAACRDGNQGDEATGLIFDPGTPVVRSAVTTAHQVIVAIEAAGGRYWAECFIHLDDQEFASGMSVHDSSARDDGLSYGFGPGCGLVDGDVDPACTTFSVSTASRLPDDVAAVRYDLAGDASETAPSRAGFVVLNYLGPLPEGVATSGNGLPDVFMPITRITYLDAAGTPIAAQAMDGSGAGRDHNRVDGLPTLDAYPSLGGAQVS